MRCDSNMSAPLYNLDYLKQVFQGNDAMVHRILDLFEVEVPRYFDTMKELAAQGRWRELHPIAHKAKSSIGMLGMQGLLEKVIEVERLSRTGSDDAALAVVLNQSGVLLSEAMSALLAQRPQPTQGSDVRRASQPKDSGRYKRLHRA